MRRRTVLSIGSILLLGAGLFLVLRPAEDPGQYHRRPAGTVTFTEHIAPIIYPNCTPCHRPDQAAPFSFLAYEEVQKRARQIAEVTQSRYMPPWMPSAGYGEFEGERRLTEDQIGLINQWAEEGAPQGDLAKMPASPRWSDSWHLGEPDLVVSMPQTFTLPASGPDVYRNFVIPIPTSERRFVRAVEFDPGNPSIVHHAFIRFDRTRQSRLRDEEDRAPGFDGIHTPPSAQPPEGYFLSWQPGRLPSPPRPGHAWALHQNTDVVLQMHLQPSGKPEPIQARVGFYFTEDPPKFAPLKIWLTSYQIEIPAGETNYLLEDDYTLPVDVEVLAVLPHAHYLGKTMEAFAVLPDGARRELLRIERWDFNWQGDYRYAHPISLPKGSQIKMRFHYDNSTNNPANPHHPPQVVRYGLQSTDEMGELWFQVLTESDAANAAISRDYEKRLINETIAYNTYLLMLNPNDGKAESGIGKALYFLGRYPEAAQRFRRAMAQAPSYDEPHYFMGLMFRRQDQLLEAIRAFRSATQLNSANGRAWGNLGQVYLELLDYGQAEQTFQRALEANPDDALAHDGLGVALFHQGRLAEARAEFQLANQLAPEDAGIKQRLAAAQAAIDAKQ